MKLKLSSYHGDQAIKDKYIARMKAHMIADELIQGIGFDGHKGCAVGCTLNKYSHYYAYEMELGIPFTLAILEDNIFEGLNKKDAMTFPIEFLEAIPLGKDLGNIYNKFEIWQLVDETHGLIIKMQTKEEKDICQDLASLHQKVIDGKEIHESEFKKVADRAYRAYSADRADRAYSAYCAYCADSAYCTYSADSAYRAYSPYSAYRAYCIYRTYLAPKMRIKLIELIKAA